MGNRKYAYVTNNVGDNRDWPRCGNTFTKSDIFGYNYKGEKLAEGFKAWDVFVRYGNGEPVVIDRKKIRKKASGKNLVWHAVRALKEEERERLAKSFRQVERELRYQANSYVWKRHEVERLRKEHDALALADIITRTATDKYLGQLASTALITLGYVAIILPTRYDLLKGGRKPYRIKKGEELVFAKWRKVIPVDGK